MNNTNGFGIALTAAAFVALIGSLFLMILWNLALVPAIMGVQPISWLQALGLYFLSNILFKNTSSIATNNIK